LKPPSARHFKPFSKNITNITKSKKNNKNKLKIKKKVKKKIRGEGKEAELLSFSF